MPTVTADPNLSPPLAPPAADPSLLSCAVADFFLARKPRKDSPHTSAAYRRDLDAVALLCAQRLAREPGQLHLAELTVRVLRAAFADYAESRAKTSISRAWSTWNQFFVFCVGDGRI